ncbi:MAG: dienelactone hydrolase family protein [Microthrixaceae bacterium]
MALGPASRTENAVTPEGVALTVAFGPGHPTGAIVVLHEIWGLTDAVIDLVARLAADGYIVAAPHLYHRMGSAYVEDGTYRLARRAHDALRAESIRSDLESAVAWCRTRGADKVAVIGFSMGGTIALWAAAELDIDAAITFYGGGIAAERWPGVLSGIEAAETLRAPWLGIYGGRDRSTPARDIEAMRTVLPKNGRSKIVTYPDAKHGFALDPASSQYMEKRALEAFDVMAGFLEDHLR